MLNVILFSETNFPTVGHVQMKVTVCFGSTRIVVPVGDGNITVAHLTEKSLARFRKVAKKVRTEIVAKCFNFAI